MSISVNVRKVSNLPGGSQRRVELSFRGQLSAWEREKEDALKWFGASVVHMREALVHMARSFCKNVFLLLTIPCVCVCVSIFCYCYGDKLCCSSGRIHPENQSGAEWWCGLFQRGQSRQSTDEWWHNVVCLGVCVRACVCGCHGYLSASDWNCFNATNRNLLPLLPNLARVHTHTPSTHTKCFKFMFLLLMLYYQRCKTGVPCSPFNAETESSSGTWLHPSSNGWCGMNPEWTGARKNSICCLHKTVTWNVTIR